MPIVSSVITADQRQKDGRRRIDELHTDQVGVKYPYTYLALSAFDANAALAARATMLNALISDAEITQNIREVVTLGAFATPTFVYSTVAQNAAALRAAYLIATRIEAVMIGDFLSTLTDVQLQNAFGLTAGQVTTLRTSKLTPAHDLADSIRAASGA